VTLPTERDPVQFYSKNLSHTLLTAIDRAKESIEISVFRLSDPSMLGALARAQDRGVKVSITTDKGSRAYHCFPWEKAEKSGLMHEKILLIDDVQAYIGSANFTEDSLLAHKNLITGFYSKKLVDVIREGTPTSTVHVGNYSLEIWRLPSKNNAPIERIQNLLDSAGESIKLSMYTLTEPNLIDALISGHKRGVDVQLDLDRNSWKAIDKLKNEGVTTTIANRYPLTHNKDVTIDKNVIILGSANWTKSAFKRNKDIFVIINKA
jgi:cardiolipin synthase A/B